MITFLVVFRHVRVSFTYLRTDKRPYCPTRLEAIESHSSCSVRQETTHVPGLEKGQCDETVGLEGNGHGTARSRYRQRCGRSSPAASRPQSEHYPVGRGTGDIYVWLLQPQAARPASCSRYAGANRMMIARHLCAEMSSF